MLSYSRTKSNMNIFHLILLVIYYFVSIFRPPLVSINITNILIALNNCIIIFGLIKKRTASITKDQLHIIAGFVPFVLYYTLLTIIHIFASQKSGLYFDAYISTLSAFVYIVLFVGASIQLFNRFSIKIDQFINILILVFFIQLIFVVGAFLFPSVKQTFLNLIYKNLQSDVVVSATMRESRFRCFGLADNLFDSLGYISALAISTFFGYGISNKKKIIVIISFIMLFIPLVNARTGLVLASAGIIIVFFQFFEFKKVLKYVIVIALAIVVINMVLDYLPEGIKKWLDVGMEATVGLTRGEKSSAYEDIFGTDIVWPDDLFFGDGASPERLGRYTGIDSGYIQCLWNYGIVGTFLLFYGYIGMFVKAYKNRFGHYIIPIGFIFFIYLLKIFGIYNFGSIAFVFLIPILSLREKVNGDESNGSI